MSRPRGRRELTTTKVAKLFSTGRSWLPDWTREVPAKVNSYHGGRTFLSLRGAKRRSNLGGESSEIATPRQVGARNDKRAWCWMKEAATKSWRRDLQMPVSSFYFGDGRESMTRFILLPRSPRCRVISGQDGVDKQDDYLCPWSILHREGGGRSWAMNNTSNICGVE